MDSSVNVVVLMFVEYCVVVSSCLVVCFADGLFA